VHGRARRSRVAALWPPAATAVRLVQHGRLIKVTARGELTDLQRTAISAATLRAAHTIAGDEPKIFRDPLALGLCGMTADEAVAMAARVPPQSASTCVLRSRFTEDRLAAAAAGGRIGQYVILGAGLDSFALRAEGKGLVVFEVDDPAFLAWKRQRIDELGLAVPDHLRFAPCDFEATRLEDALAAGGFDAGEPCFVSMLGVTQYLTLPAIRKTLAWAGSRPAGSEIVLSFLDRNEGTRALSTSMASTGVAVLSSFSEDEITRLLRQAGFGTIDHLSPRRAHEDYFAGRSDGLVVPGMQRLVAARID
jgi:methyltransferase (TIGR00027 family)